MLQKFSKRGWICKTYEGEVAQYVVGGVAPQIWNFSVRDDAVAEQLHKAVSAAHRAFDAGRRCVLVITGKGAQGGGVLRSMDDSPVEGLKLAYIGDDVNDVPMLSRAGLGVAMGNARPEIQAVAKRVIGHNKDEGLAAFLEELVEQHTVTPMGDEAKTGAASDARLLALDNVVLLPHLASATHETRRAMGERTLAKPLPAGTLIFDDLAAVADQLLL